MLSSRFRTLSVTVASPNIISKPFFWHALTETINSRFCILTRSQISVFSIWSILIFFSSDLVSLFSGPLQCSYSVYHYAVGSSSNRGRIYFSIGSTTKKAKKGKPAFASLLESKVSQKLRRKIHLMCHNFWSTVRALLLNKAELSFMLSQKNEGVSCW